MWKCILLFEDWRAEVNKTDFCSIMISNKYDLSESLDRMGTILSGNGELYRRFSFIPERDVLAEVRGAFVDSVVLVSRLYFKANDISPLGLAKIFDMYISEVRCIMSEPQLCRKVFLNGSIITGIYSIGTVGYMNSIMDVAGRVCTLPEVINVKSGRKDNPVIGNVCAMEKGQLFAKQTEDGVDYFGNMISRAEGWLVNAEKKKLPGLFLSKQVHAELKTQYQSFFHDDEFKDVLYGRIESIGMARWVKEQ